jgi:hypothetical protein
MTGADIQTHAQHIPTKPESLHTTQPLPVKSYAGVRKSLLVSLAETTCTRCKFAVTSPLAGMCLQTFNARHHLLQSSTCRTFHTSFSRLALQHLHDVTRMKHVRMHPCEWSRPCQLSSCTCDLCAAKPLEHVVALFLICSITFVI